MAKKLEEIRFLCVEGNTEEAANRIAMLMGDQVNSKFINYYLPGHNAKLIVYQFSNTEEKEKFLNFPDIERELRNKCKCIFYTPNIVEDPNIVHRMVFVYALNPCYFYRFDKQNGVRETLEERMDAVMHHLKSALPEGVNENHRFIQHMDDRTGIKKAPKTYPY